MRASTASMVLAFCAILAVQAAPVSTGSTVAGGTEMEKRGTQDFEYDASGNEIDARDSDFEYDAAGNETEAREPKKGNAAKATSAVAAKRDSDFEYDAEGYEIEARDSDFEYDANGNEINNDEVDKRDSAFEYDAAGNEIDADDEE